jgi:CRISPR-associated protein Cas5t
MVVILLAEVKVIKLHISAPSGHFRIIHTNDPQRSYPLPPYSTIIGLLANILGNKELINEMLTNNFSLGIISKHDTISIEYTWMRNLNKSFHVNRFILPNNRYHHESREHMGGQVPISVEVLNDVNLYIYVSHPSDIIMNSLLENTKYPERWFSHLHLGRSEDWACIEEVSFQILSVSNRPDDFSNVNQYYQWLPRPEAVFGIDKYLPTNQYKSLYQKMQGNIVLVTSLYKLVEAPYSNDGYIRNFDHIPARLTNNPVPFLDDFTLPELFVDQELNVPVYMVKIPGGGMHNE